MTFFFYEAIAELRDADKPFDSGVLIQVPESCSVGLLQMLTWWVDSKWLKLSNILHEYYKFQITLINMQTHKHFRHLIKTSKSSFVHVQEVLFTLL